ncbi:molybdopterin cofactor-binding domain-containing protein [Streptomyces sp. NPDC047023]|uniref:xanthine dehydrogenase family protein molybdopterin-binding subunit n=1 Tax=Streptomyces sp. NPDC047023 TaxID=3155139 RepID=UPI0033D8C627
MSTQDPDRQSSGHRQETVLLPATIEPLSFVRLNTDDTVTVISQHMEMGQGIYTGLATLIAEELDASWEQVRVATPDGGEGGPYGNILMGNAQGTGGQTSMQNSYLRMRKAGAAMRAMIVGAAAARWGVDAGQVSVKEGVVSSNGNRATFGELAEEAMAFPVPEEVTLKSPEQFVLTGRKLPRLDGPDKIRGKTKFTMDLQFPGMMTACIRRPERAGQKVASFDASKALRIDGVLHVVEVPNGVAVVATDIWTAWQGRDALEIEWDLSEAFRKSSEDIMSELRELVTRPGADAGTIGDFDSAIATAAQVVEHEYEVPYHTHAPMEPLNVVLQFAGDEVNVWGGSQMATLERGMLAQAAGVGMDKVNLHFQVTGGSFGRRASPHGVPVLEALSIVQAIGTDQPVKLMYDRPDDMSGPYNYYRPAFAHRITAGLDEAGRIVAWRHRMAGQSITTGTAFEEAMVTDGIDVFSVEGSVEQPYAIPNIRLELHTPTYPIRNSWLRTSGDFHNTFANESMIDELARLVGVDPVEYRRQVYPADSRELACIELAAEKAGWIRPLAADPQGRRRGRGIAAGPSHRSFGAAVVEITLHEDGKGYDVDRVVAAMDCGRIINPDNVISQVEGSVAFGLSLARWGQITYRDGVVEQNFFSDYHVTRMDNMPVVETYLVESEEGPSGASETVASMMAPAVANALLDATGVAHRKVLLKVEGEVDEHWDVPATINTFEGAVDWAFPEGWIPISSREGH